MGGSGGVVARLGRAAPPPPPAGGRDGVPPVMSARVRANELGTGLKITPLTEPAPRPSDRETCPAAGAGADASRGGWESAPLPASECKRERSRWVVGSAGARWACPGRRPSPPFAPRGGGGRGAVLAGSPPPALPFPPICRVGLPTTRLETRTKESAVCASEELSSANGCVRSRTWSRPHPPHHPRGGGGGGGRLDARGEGKCEPPPPRGPERWVSMVPGTRGGPGLQAPPDQRCQCADRDLSACADNRTRKVVNYSWRQ